MTTHMMAGATIAAAASAFCWSASAYEIKSKAAESAFSAKFAPDIVGMSGDTEGAKAGGVYETYVKDLAGVKPDVSQVKFGSTSVTYVTSVKFKAPASAKNGAESMESAFTSPASGNRAYYVMRELGFVKEQQPSKAEMIQRVTTKYGPPTLIGDGHIFYFYKGGKTISVKQKYDGAAAVAALDAPINPKAAVALNDANGRGSCVGVAKRAEALDKTLGALAAEASRANCEGLIEVTLTPGITPDRVGKADFVMYDFKRIVSAGKIDAEAFAAEKNESLTKTPMGNAPKL